MTDNAPPHAPQASLQDNASAFFARFFEKHGSDMRCGAGCAACCHAEIGIFESEAARIIAGVRGMSAPERGRLLASLEAPSDPVGRTPHGTSGAPCAFLRDGLCAIYQVRPVICRTQGVALQIKTKVDKDNVEVALDACPLNFTREGSFPKREEALDLDRLTVMQTIAENHYQERVRSAGAEDAAGVDAARLAALKDRAGRIPLRSLARELARLVGDDASAR